MNLIYEPSQHLEFTREGGPGKYVPPLAKTVELLQKHLRGTTTEIYLAWGGKSGLPNGAALIRVSVLAGAEPTKPYSGTAEILTVALQTERWRAFEAECDGLAAANERRYAERSAEC